MTRRASSKLPFLLRNGGLDWLAAPTSAPRDVCKRADDGSGVRLMEMNSRIFVARASL